MTAQPIWIIKNNLILVLITSAKSLFPYKVIYSQVPEIKMWISSGNHYLPDLVGMNIIEWFCFLKKDGNLQSLKRLVSSLSIYPPSQALKCVCVCTQIHATGIYKYLCIILSIFSFASLRMILI